MYGEIRRANRALTEDNGSEFQKEWRERVHELKNKKRALGQPQRREKWRGEKWKRSVHPRQTREGRKR